MQVSKISAYSGYKSLNKSTSSVQSTIALSKQGEADSISFNSKPVVVENFILNDLRGTKSQLTNFKNFSKKLQDNIMNISFYQVCDRTKGDIFVIEDKTKGKFIIKTDEANGIRPGFVAGKSGFYATLELPVSKDKSCSIILPENSELRAENGVQVTYEKIEDVGVAFKGKVPTVTVRSCTLPNETHKSVMGFMDRVKNDPIFKNFSQAAKDYWKDFHPYVLAGGFGSRLEVISDKRGNNKPSTATPIPGFDLMHFSLLNLFQANLLNKNSKIDFSVEKEANGAVGCFITTLGYSIAMTDEGLDLVKDGESIVPPDKNIVIIPSDNITDVNLADALEAYNNSKDVGMMVVGVPDYRCYGGLIRHDKDNIIEEFITKPSAELLAEGDDYIRHTDHKGVDHILKDSNGQATSLGNAFIYIINPEALDTIVGIYRDKIRNAYNELMTTNGPDYKMTEEECHDMKESFWDREIIPELVRMSNNGEFRNPNGDKLNVKVYRAVDADYSDAGEYTSYGRTMINASKRNAFSNFPRELKEELAKNIQGDTIFLDSEAKDAFNKLLGKNGFVKGDVMVVPKQ